MCISFPARVTHVSDDGAIAEAESMVDGSIIDVNILFLQDVNVGDYIIVHSGIGVRVVSRDHAMQICSIFRDSLKEEYDL
ncbi:MULTISPECIES: HypC/HybG/HupF family hydrogenase formation chaperone [Candidatus Nitrosocaldus]|jgi:hydrogenase expression/formation protein HypC|uniref:Putative Hydrogenase assembly chaperone HypC/HupF n=1 Tax=Candidatus Nitrosocaldus cavascurensis TaxID=2058097 RepID=A0A2K5AQI3_9ARCH|nr:MULTISPECIES: HypC/HybG/HupF family hydrogenase formation chaperone [Candidatus Nitrosocaldus]SPC33859.1 putative Hydrogenase assembly chaperone HypC/HupF [Candidatus Nitrosocaldus cavascurensis]